MVAVEADADDQCAVIIKCNGVDSIIVEAFERLQGLHVNAVPDADVSAPTNLIRRHMRSGASNYRNEKESHIVKINMLGCIHTCPEHTVVPSAGDKSRQTMSSVWPLKNF